MNVCSEPKTAEFQIPCWFGSTPCFKWWPPYLASEICSRISRYARTPENSGKLISIALMLCFHMWCWLACFDTFGVPKYTLLTAPKSAHNTVLGSALQCVWNCPLLVHMAIQVLSTSARDLVNFSRLRLDYVQCLTPGLISILDIGTKNIPSGLCKTCRTVHDLTPPRLRLQFVTCLWTLSQLAQFSSVSAGVLNIQLYPCGSLVQQVHVTRKDRKTLHQANRFFVVYIYFL